MQNTRIVYKNRWRDGTIIAASSEQGQFPAECTQDDNTTIVWRSASGALTPTVDCDLGAAYEYDFIGILNHNFTASATIQIKGADDSAFTVNVVTDSISFNGTNIYAFLGSARTKRYVRLYVSDATNPNNYIQAAVLIVGKYYDLGVQFTTEHEDGYVDYSETAETPSLNSFLVSESPSLRHQNMEWTHLTDAVKAYIAAMMEECGKHKAWVLCLDYSSPNSYTYWVVTLSDNLVAYKSYNHWTYAAEIREHV